MKKLQKCRRNLPKTLKCDCEKVLFFHPDQNLNLQKVIASLIAYVNP
jgi:hypothetical protein